jgi:hypothetical protein
MSPTVKQMLRVLAGIVAAAAAGTALYIAADLLDVLTRPVNQGWADVLLIMFLPLFMGIALLALAAAFLGRYAWVGTFFGKAT